MDCSPAARQAAPVSVSTPAWNKEPAPFYKGRVTWPRAPGCLSVPRLRNPELPGVLCKPKVTLQPGGSSKFERNQHSVAPSLRLAAWGSHGITARNANMQAAEVVQHICLARHLVKESPGFTPLSRWQSFLPRCLTHSAHICPRPSTRSSRCRCGPPAPSPPSSSRHRSHRFSLWTFPATAL